VTPLDVYFCGGSQVAGMGLPVTQALPVQVTRALRERWGKQVGHAYMLEYSGAPGDLERALRTRRIPRPFILILVPRNVYVWGVPQLGDLRRYFGGVAALDAAIVPDAGRTRSVAAEQDVPSRRPLRQAWLVVRSAGKSIWYALWLPTLPWWALRYARGLWALRCFARQAGCRLFVLATPVPLDPEHARAPGLHWYVALLARYLRAQDGGDTVVADLYARLQDPSGEPLQFWHDRMVHLTIQGTQRAATVVLDALEAGAQRGKLLGGAG
jgi:hypothetical protein